MDMKGCVQLELESAVLLRLLENGALCASEFRCLDCDSKQCVWRLCLMSCEKQLGANSGSCKNCGRCEKPKTPVARTSSAMTTYNLTEKKGDLYVKRQTD